LDPWPYLTIRTAFATDVTVATAFRIFRQQAREPRVEVQEIWNKQARYIGFDKCVGAIFVAEKLGEKNSTEMDPKSRKSWKIVPPSIPAGAQLTNMQHSTPQGFREP